MVSKHLLVSPQISHLILYNDFLQCTRPYSSFREMVEESGSTQIDSMANHHSNTQMATGYDESVVGSFQSMQPWINGR